MSTAEQIIADHTLEWIGHQCACGEQFTTGKTYRDGMGVLRRKHAAHVVAALTNAGKTIVELPEADAVASEDEFDAWGVTIDHEPATVCALKHYRVVAIDDHIGQMSPAEARGFAAALLAAARVAEGGGQP